MKKPGKKWLVLGFVIIVAAMAAMSIFKGLKAEAYTVKRQNVKTTVTEKGKLVSGKTENIFSGFSGTVKQVLVDEGETVKPGTVLAVMDTADLEAQIGRLEGELTAASGAELSSPAGGSAQIQQQQLAVEQARQLLKQKEANYKRNKELYTTGAVTYVELEQSATDYQTQVKAVAQLEQELAVTRQQSKGNKLQFEGQKQSVVSQLTQLKEQKLKGRIISGVEGVVFSKKVSSGDYVSPDSVLFVVGDRDNLKIETYISAMDMVNSGTGDSVTVVFKKYGKDVETTGVISKVAPVTQEVTSALGIIEDKVKVTIELDKKPAGINLIPGMAVDVRIVTAKAQHALSVPKDSVFSDNGRDFVWVVKNGSAVLAQVQTGIEGDELTEIKSGISENDVIILDPHQAGLKEGARVTAIK